MQDDLKEVTCSTFFDKSGLKDILDAFTEEKDTAVIVDNKFKLTSHITAQVNQANRIMSLITRSFWFRRDIF